MLVSSHNRETHGKGDPVPYRSTRQEGYLDSFGMPGRASPAEGWAMKGQTGDLARHRAGWVPALESGNALVTQRGCGVSASQTVVLVVCEALVLRTLASLSFPSLTRHISCSIR